MAASSNTFPALPGIYRLVFLHLEPMSTILPFILACFFPGAAWFHSELIPTPNPLPLAAIPPLTEPRTVMAVWQLGNCYFLLGLISSFVFRAVRDALPDNPVAQERILGASFTALAIADVTHMALSIRALPEALRWDVTAWNATTHGNITFVVFLVSLRLAWFAGIGRTRYYFGQPQSKTTGKKRAD